MVHLPMKTQVSFAAHRRRGGGPEVYIRWTHLADVVFSGRAGARVPRCRSPVAELLEDDIMRPHRPLAVIRSLATIRSLVVTATLLVATAPGVLAETDAFVEEYADHPLGVVDHLNYDGVAALDAHWMRMPVSWRYIEPVDDEFNWSSGLDTWLAEAEARDINGTLIIACNQFWATGHGTEQDWPSHPPADMQQVYDPAFGYSESYYDFISNLLINYGSRIDRLTIENEVNTREFWAGTMDEYRRLVATARKAVDEHAPHILLFDSGVGSGSLGVAIAEWMIDSGEVPADEILTFVNDYYEYDVYAPLNFGSLEELQYWIYQPFVQENNKRVDTMFGAVAEHIDGLNFKFTNSAWLLPTLVEWVDRRLALHGYSLPLKVNNEASNWPRGSAVEEGQNLFEMVVLGLASGVDKTIWFPYSDEFTNSPRLGLLDENGDPTLQAFAFQTLGQYIGNVFEFVSADTLGDDILRFRFSEEGDSRIGCDVMWWDDGGHGSGSEMVSYELPPFTEAVTRISYDGMATDVPMNGDTLTTTVPEGGEIYMYTLTPIGVPTDPAVVPVLSQNAPNPFRTSTTIELSLPESIDGEAVALRIFDAQGRRVRTLASGPMSAGTHALTWDGRDDRGIALPVGSYWYRLRTAESTVSRRLLLVR
jgi:hypothetical protein